MLRTQTNLLNNQNPRPRYAGVSLLDNPFPIDGIYDYMIPTEYDGEVTPGAFVVVPFGVSNRHKLALVETLKQTPDYPEVKQIISVCPSVLSLDEEMLGLCSFMKLRTLCSTGDAVRAMIPASALTKLVTVYSLAPQHTPPHSDELSSSDLFVYQTLQKKGECTEAALRAEFGAGVEARLSRLCARGYAVRNVISKESTEGKAVRVWEIALSYEEVYALLDGRHESIKLRSEKQKTALSVLLESDEPMTTKELCEAAKLSSDAPLRTLQSHGIIAAEERRLDRNPYTDFAYEGRRPINLNEEQSAALDTLSALAFSGQAKAALLHGVTGSGKTAVMTALIDRLLDAGKGAIVLLPEIALTPQSVSVFCARYGSRVAVIHSGLSAGERLDAYMRIRRGVCDVVIGTRSAAFAPVKNLGAIIIDEEQEHTYKSDQNPKYHTKDIARYRCAHNKALMLLSSATPSLESYQKAKEGVYTLVKLKHRYGGAELPRVEIADMRRESGAGNLSPLGEKLLGELVRTKAMGEQSILFLNRRGYNHFFSCRSCGEAVVCPACSVAMTYHTRRGNYQEGELVCHWCGRRMPIPRTCPSCSSEHIARMGFGTQRVEEEVQKLLPSARLLRMDADTTATKFSYDRMLSDFRFHKADVLLGTQMVTKGHDFPDVTLVGVLLADASLYLDDYRAGERTFSMLTQVIGRAGRARRPGLAVIQTNNPDSEIIKLAVAQDYESFYEREIRLRRALVFPPFCDIALFTMSSGEEQELFRSAKLFQNLLENARKEEYKDVELVTFGPFEAPVYRVDNRYRMRMVIKCKLTRRTLALFASLYCEFYQKAGRKTTLGVDLNPSNL